MNQFDRGLGSNVTKTHSELPVDHIESVETSGTGTTFVALPDVPGARMVRIVKPSVDVLVRNTGGTATLTVLADTESPVIYVGSNSNQLEIKRSDESDTQVEIELLIGVY